MDPTNPTDNTQVAQVNTEVETPDKSNVQKRFDEMTAEKYALQKQVQDLTASMAEIIKAQTEATQRQQVQVKAPEAPQMPSLPEGTDPALIKFFEYQNAQMKRMQEETQNQTQKLFWQMQNQLDQGSVNNKYANLPEEVRRDAANRLTGLKQRFGDAATIDDAMGLAHWEWMKKQGQGAAARAFNGMNGPMTVQTYGPNVSQQAPSSTLAPPTQDPNWDNYSNAEQIQRIEAWEKKGGRLL